MGPRDGQARLTLRTARFVLALTLITASACNSTTVAPSSLTANWTGYVVYTVNGVTGSQNISMMLTQVGPNITGSYFATSQGYFSLAQQPVRGTASLTFTGSLNFVTDTTVGCAGEIAVSGSPAGSELEWKGSTASSTCGSYVPTGVFIQLMRNTQ